MESLQHIAKKVSWFIFFLAFLNACSSVRFPTSNVSNDQILSLEKGQSTKSILARLGKPFYWKKYDDGSYSHIYTNDWLDGSQVFCRNLAISYDSNQFLIKYEFTNNFNSPHQRCRNYSAQSRQDAAAWSSVADTYVETLNDKKSSSGIECWSDGQCNHDQVCAKKKSPYGSLEQTGICSEVRYYEGD